MSGVRLNKALASAGVCSRRAADELILAGAVALNGVVITEPGTRMDPERDALTVNDKPVRPPLPERRDFTYVLLHKPVRVVTTADDPEGRTTVLDLLPEELKRLRLFPVGRLDYFSEGLLLITDDGDLTNRLTHPRHHLSKIYEVRLRELPAPEHLRRMRTGMTLAEGERLAPMEAEVVSRRPVVLRLTLRQGINRQIRRACRDLGLTILRLTRISLGPLVLGDLPAGESRLLTPAEIHELRSATGLGGEEVKNQRGQNQAVPGKRPQRHPADQPDKDLDRQQREHKRKQQAHGEEGNVRNRQERDGLVQVKARGRKHDRHGGDERVLRSRRS